ncbi:penicillin-binding protein 1A [Alteriqipengyuania lutimaris]|uniref:peptidoglycan glycosyltransferase n=1 Tax=Alteriqipengyuania lutimaris TaxID=1538146 RepID=A0A395LM97_9SPHN|nr:transglycosylase domain-containing protein [Alteriqipengyuania lutimaris]MBB3032770.1 penicillin-binding protein 1A [Alteriqipengyuania lutimaris]RDS78128.1 penicillin-binding protein [Alteriqipengyuania lutimaris]
MTEISVEHIRYRIQRDGSDAFAQFRKTWRDNWAVRWIVYGTAAFLLLIAIAWFLIGRDLPDAAALQDYETPLPTVVRGADGEIVGSYARDRRVQLNFVDFPTPLINAFLSAEDETFWSHNGVDITGTANAVLDYARKAGTDERAVGGSTITQQVAKNVLLSDEYSVTRKLREMLVARRIEQTLSKQEILTLYLNEIPLGRRSFGVQAAARAYFDKDVGDLDLHEMAFLAILPKAPERYGRERYEELAISRRNWVLGQMEDNGWATPEAVRAAQNEPLGLTSGASNIRNADAGYFIEEVRRQLLDRFGETSDDGPNSVYAGGLWVRTSLDLEYQDAARDALREGMLRYHGGRGWSGPVATLNPDKGDLTSQLASANIGINYEDWRVAVFTGSGAIGFSDGETATLTGAPGSLQPGDVVAVRPSGNSWRLAVIPEASGGIVVEDPQTGRIMAMQGGWDSRLESFNRATQANRQPGSTVKAFVYATGLDQGMTPATQVDNSSFCAYQGRQLGQKCVRGGRAGTYTLRYGLENSQNVMTANIANDAGMPNVIKTYERVGIGSYEPYIAFALGAGETTVEKMTNAFATLANHGRYNDPTVIDYVQDRRGKVIWRADQRACEGCNMAEYDGSAMPRLGPMGRQAMDARTAFQITHIMEGVITRGTAKVLRGTGLPLFGKTGTTTGPKDVWFVGGTQQLVVGTYLGFDQPRNMGGYAQGGTIAAPIVKSFIDDTRDRWRSSPPVAPAGVRMVRIDRRTGGRVYDAWPTTDENAAIIWEAFKPDTEPPRSTRASEIAAQRQELLDLVRRARRAQNAANQVVEREEPPENFVEEQGGIY